MTHPSIGRPPIKWWSVRPTIAIGGLLWMQSIQHVLFPVPALRLGAMILLATYVVLTCRQALPLTQRIAFVCLGLIVVGLATGTPFEALLAGLDMALLFTGFFPALALIRWLIGGTDTLGRIGSELGRMPARLRDHATLVAAHAIGGVMTMGAFAALAPPFERLGDVEARQEGGLVAIRGVSLAVLWTPFTVGMGFASNHLPQVPLWQGISCGLVLALVGMMISLRESNPFRLGPSLVLVRQMGLPVLAAALFLMVGNALTGISGISLIIVSAPPIIALITVWHAPDRLPAMAEPIRRELGGMGNELLLFTTSIAMGTVLAQNSYFQASLAHLGLASLPIPVVFALVVCVAIGCALAGLHSSVIGTVIIALTGGLPETFSPLVVFMLILFGWFCGAMLSLSSLSVTIVSRSFGTPLNRILHGPNVVFAAEMGLVLIFAFTVLHAFGLA